MSLRLKIWTPEIEEINHPDKAVYAELTSATDEFEQSLNLSHTDIVRVVTDADENGKFYDETVPASSIRISNN